MRLSDMEWASRETMERLGFYWGGCSYDEGRPVWIGLKAFGRNIFIVVVAYSVGDSCWFAEAYDLFDLGATVDGEVNEMPQKALDKLIDRLERQFGYSKAG